MIQNTLIVTLANCLLIVVASFANGQDDPAAIYEVTDHSRGFSVRTESPDWSVQVSRFTFTMIDSPTFSTLKINKAFSQTKSPEETIQAYLATAKKNENAEILSEDITLNIGGEEAKGYSFVVLKNRKTFVYVWFQKNGGLYKVEIQAKEKDFEAFMNSSQKVFDSIEYLEEAQQSK